ncbi:MAG: histidine kinase, partial [Lachnospiraceae bacterium]|nr:histidine kinase [Lachnospiraceae bacterium]
LPIVIMNISPYAPEGIPYTVLYILLLLLLVFIVSAVLVAAYIRNNITKPVFELSKKMDSNKQTGELNQIEKEMKFSELEMLKTSYNSMIDYVKELIGAVIDKEKTVQRMEMRVLQEQIKPHFLYNSIETIGYLALEAGADKVHNALETLGSFYRNFLSKGSREITLAREIAIVKDYLSLQKLRYGDIIEDEYDISDDVKNFIVPKLILQPIVENSIYHGIRIKGEKGTIKITGRRVDNALHLIVRDTGVGMSREQIEEILNKKRDDSSEDEGASFGLWDTIERIRIFCNREDVVRIRSEAGEYTEIELIIYSEGLWKE